MIERLLRKDSRIGKSLVGLTGAAAFAGGMLTFASAPAVGATISFLSGGTALNTGNAAFPSFSSADAKFSTDGYFLPLTTSSSGGGVPTNEILAPSYIVSGSIEPAVAAVPTEGGGFGPGYAQVSDLSGAHGAVGSPMTSGIFFNKVGTGAVPVTTQADIAQFTIGAGAPSSFIVGVMTNVDTSQGDYPDELRLRDSGGGDSGLQATLAPTAPTGKVDFYFFQINGASAGDVLTLSGVEDHTIATAGGPETHLGIAGLVFPGSTLPAPEPGPAAMLGVGLLGFVGFMRRRKLSALPTSGTAAH